MNEIYKILTLYFHATPFFFFFFFYILFILVRPWNHSSFHGRSSGNIYIKMIISVFFSRIISALCQSIFTLVGSVAGSDPPVRQEHSRLVDQVQGSTCFSSSEITIVIAPHLD